MNHLVFLKPNINNTWCIWNTKSQWFLQYFKRILRKIGRILLKSRHKKELPCTYCNSRIWVWRSALWEIYISGKTDCKFRNALLQFKVTKYIIYIRNLHFNPFKPLGALSHHNICSYIWQPQSLHVDRNEIVWDSVWTWTSRQKIASKTINP